MHSSIPRLRSLEFANNSSRPRGHFPLAPSRSSSGMQPGSDLPISNTSALAPFIVIASGGVMNRRIGTGTTGRKMSRREGGRLRRMESRRGMKGIVHDVGQILSWSGRRKRRERQRVIRGVHDGEQIKEPILIIGGSVMEIPPDPMGASKYNYYEGPLNSTSRFSYRIGADRAEEIIDAVRARIVRFI
jgi:hypothetical protein